MTHCTATASIAATQEFSRAKQLLDTCWGKLTDFSSWKQWWPGLQGALKLDEGQLGRGSHVQLDFEDESGQWQVSYYNSPRRLDIQRLTVTSAIAYSFELDISPTCELVLGITMEWELRGWRAIAEPLFRRRYSKQLSKMATRLQTCLKPPI